VRCIAMHDHEDPDEIGDVRSRSPLCDPALVHAFIEWWVEERRRTLTPGLCNMVVNLEVVARHWLQELTYADTVKALLKGDLAVAHAAKRSTRSPLPASTTSGGQDHPAPPGGPGARAAARQVLYADAVCVPGSAVAPAALPGAAAAAPTPPPRHAASATTASRQPHEGERLVAWADRSDADADVLVPEVDEAFWCGQYSADRGTWGLKNGSQASGVE
jgi:hypothetical protein